LHEFDWRELSPRLMVQPRTGVLVLDGKLRLGPPWVASVALDGIDLPAYRSWPVKVTQISDRSWEFLYSYNHGTSATYTISEKAASLLISIKGSELYGRCELRAVIPAPLSPLLGIKAHSMRVGNIELVIIDGQGSVVTTRAYDGANNALLFFAGGQKQNGNAGRH